LLFAIVLLLLVAGCQSSQPADIEVDQSADETAHNQLLVRAALAENVYNHAAVERTLYPRDFKPGSATLNALGESRINMIIDASRDAHGNVSILRGEESDETYQARIIAVRDELKDAGINLDHVTVAGGLPNSPTVSSPRAIITYDRMMTDYAPKKSSNAKGSFQVTPLDQDSKGK
jgi:hypothetical protein